MSIWFLPLFISLDHIIILPFQFRNYKSLLLFFILHFYYILITPLFYLLVVIVIWLPLLNAASIDAFNAFRISSALFVPP